MEELLKHKHDKILWSELDWLVNYKPKIEDKTPNWMNCKLLGSYLGTTKDITNRKSLSLQSMKKFDDIFNSKKICRELKIKTFNTYISCIFLYNSELWSLTKNTEEQINAFQRRLLRYAIGIRWPQKITNEKLYHITKEEQWSKRIKRRRLTFLGHILRLPNDALLKKALTESFTKRVNKQDQRRHG